MKETPINPGSSNLIYPLSELREVFNRTEIMNGTIEDKGMDFDYRIEAFPEFTRLAIDIQYTHFAKDSDYILKVLQAPYSFLIKMVTIMFPKDLLVVLEYCIKGINHAAALQVPRLKNLPPVFPPPIWEDHKLLLTEIAQGLNDTI